MAEMTAVYRCVRCNQEVQGASAEATRMKNMLDYTMGGNQTWDLKGQVAHDCPDGGASIAKLVGAVPKR